MSDPDASPRLALACFAIWFASVACAGFLGIWLAAGGVALVLGAWVLVTNASRCRDALRPHLGTVAIGLVVGSAMAAATYGVYRELAQLAPFVAQDMAHLYSAFRAPSATIGAVALTPIILGEELVWRHVVQVALTARFGRWQGALLAAVVYALALVPLRSPVMLIAALGCGLVWSALRASTKGLVAPVVAHLAWDAIVLVWLPLDAG